MELATLSSGSALSLLLVSVVLAAALFFMLSQRADERASKRPASKQRNRPEASRVDERRRAGATVCGRRTGLVLVLVARASQLAEAHPENKLKAETGNTSSVDERFAELHSTIAELTRENKRLGLAATLAQSQCAEQLALERQGLSGRQRLLALSHVPPRRALTSTESPMPSPTLYPRRRTTPSPLITRRRLSRTSSTRRCRRRIGRAQAAASRPR